MEVLSQEINDSFGDYRLRIGDRVGYLRIPVDIFDEDTMCEPHRLIPSLPKFPDTNWTRASLFRKPDGSIGLSTSCEPLRGVQNVWHEERVDVVSLRREKRYRSNVHGVTYKGRPAISKIARWEWEMPRMENETAAYRMIQTEQMPGAETLAPKVLAHLTENGRVIGFLMEKLDGVRAELSDRSDCEDALRKLHAIGMIHGDPSRYNFLINREKRHVTLIDFEHAEIHTEEKAMKELEILGMELVDESGRGAPNP